MSGQVEMQNEMDMEMEMDMDEQENIESVARDLGIDVRVVQERLETTNMLLHKYDTRFAILKLAITDESARKYYIPHIEKHNAAVLTDLFPNAGFDLFVPKTEIFNSYETKFVSMGIKCEMMNQPYRETYSDELRMHLSPAGYYLYPRSSISKTPLRLANSVGIIDSGYRGNIIAALDNSRPVEWTLEEGVRVVQICHPALYPIYVYIVEESELSDTSRKEGGFGSTGK